MTPPEPPPAAARVSGCARAPPRSATAGRSLQRRPLRSPERVRQARPRAPPPSISVVGIAYLSSPICSRRNAPEPAPLSAARQGTLRLGEARLGAEGGAAAVGRRGQASSGQ